jgi:hypothetical protein
MNPAHHVLNEAAPSAEASKAAIPGIAVAAYTSTGFDEVGRDDNNQCKCAAERSSCGSNVAWMAAGSNISS